MNLTYYGQAGFSLQIGGKTLLFDPFISGNPLAKDKISVDDIHADYILFCLLYTSDAADE